MFRPRLIRLEDRATPAAGDLDVGFGAEGLTHLTQLASIRDAILLPDGRVVAVGGVAEDISSPDRPADFGVVRLTAEGQPDPTFGDNGFVRIAFDRLANGTGNDIPYQVATLPNGGYAVVGLADLPTPGFANDITDGIAVAVLTPDGKLDPQFDADGVLTFPLAANTRSDIPTLAVRPDGTILIGGAYTAIDFTGGTAVRAFRATLMGGWDVPSVNAFDEPRTTTPYQYPTVPLFAPDGSFYRTLVTDTFNEGDAATRLGQMHRSIVQDHFLLAPDESTYTHDGSYANGAGTLVIGEFDGTPNKYDLVLPFPTTVVGADGWPLVGFVTGGFQRMLYGYSGTNAYTFQGVPDQNFGTNGISAGVPYATPATFDRLADGREYVISTGPYVPLVYGDTPYNHLARRLRNGSPDPAFGQGGSVDLTPLPLKATGLDAAADGSVIVFGSTPGDPALGNFIARYLGDPPNASATVALAHETLVSGPDGTSVQILGARGTPVDSLTLPTGFAGARGTLADLTGDGTPDIVLGTGAGSTATVRGVDGVTHATLFEARPFENFTGGVFVTAADLNGDGRPEIVVTPDAGGGPRVVVYRYDAANGLPMIDSFFGIDDANFRGGARAAIGDVNGDGRNDLAVAAGTGGGPRVAVFDGTTVGGSNRVRLCNDFFAFDPMLRFGVTLAAGDVNGDGRADIACGVGDGGGPRVTVFSGSKLACDLLAPLADFFAGDESERHGVQLVAKNLDNDDCADLMTATGTTLRAYRGVDLPHADFSAALGGVYVG